MPTNNQITEEQRNLIEIEARIHTDNLVRGMMLHDDFDAGNVQNAFISGARFALSLSSQENEKLKEVLREIINVKNEYSECVIPIYMFSVITKAESLLNNDKTEG